MEAELLSSALLAVIDSLAIDHMEEGRRVTPAVLDGYLSEIEQIVTRTAIPYNRVGWNPSECALIQFGN